MGNVSSILLIIGVTFSFFLAATAPPPTTTTSSPPDLATCLSSANIRNFTIASSQPSDDATSSFYRLLNFSIQNLRFAKPALPKPVAVILPETKSELQSTVLCCRLASMGIRIRSGGHSYEGLSYVAEHHSPFVVIDMMNLNRVRVDLDSKTAWVESGATLGETYYAIAESSDSLGFSAGSCPTVGSGGHIAGGGFGLLSRKYGLAADNVIDAVLVDSEGRFLDRESMGEDVFWAIRGGGGGGWGAIYAWRIQLLPVPKRVTGFIISRPGTSQQVAELVHKWQRVSPSLPDEFYLSAFVGAGLPEAERVGISATFKGFYLGPKSEAISILKLRFPELGVTDSVCHEMSWIESVVFFAGLAKGSSVSDLKDRELHGKGYFKAKSDYVRAHISVTDLRGAFDVMGTEPKAYVILDPYGGAMDRIRSGDLPFPHRRGNLYAIQYLIEWKEEDNWRSDEYLEWLRGFYDYMGPFVTKGPRAAYVNYLDLDLGIMESTDGIGGYRNVVEEARVWGEKYFLGNYDRLVRAKTAIDPNNVFSNAQSVPPLAHGLDSQGGEELSGHSML